MILGLDPALATCGWAVVTPHAQVRAMGVIATELDGSVARSTDRARRILHVATVLDHLVDEHAITTIAAEAMSFPRGTDGIAALALCWGAIAMLAQARGCELLEVEPKVWQRAVVPGTGRKVDYPALEKKLEAFARDTRDLARLPRRLRNHALDAMAIGVYAAVARGRGELVIRPAERPIANLGAGHG